MKSFFHITKLAVLIVFAASCLGDPLGPGSLTVAAIGGTADTAWVGAPGEPIAGGVRLRITDDAGRPLPAASLTWEAVGANSQVLNPVDQSNRDGYATATWQLGTNAAEQQQLRVVVRAGRHNHELTLTARAVPHIVSRLRVPVDTPAVLRLGDTLSFATTAIDPYGNEFPAPEITLSVSDQTIASVAASGFLGGPKRGRTAVTVTSHGVTLSLPLHIVQQVAAIRPVVDTLELRSLGAELPVGYDVLDDRGRVVADTQVTLAPVDTSIAQIFNDRVRAMLPGITDVRIAIGPVQASVAVAIQQRIASLQFRRDTILFDALRDTTTVYVVAHDSLGSRIAQPAVVLGTADERIVKAVGRTLESVNPGITAAVLRDSLSGVAASVPVIVDQRVAAIELAPVAFDALGDTTSPRAIAQDRLGSPVLDAGLEYQVDDTGVVTISGNRLRSVGEGRATLTAWDPVSGTRQTSEINVTQRVTSLELSAASVRFDALTDTMPIAYTAKDRLGAVARSAHVTYSSSDAAVVVVDQNGRTESRSNGTAVIVASSSDGPTASAAVTVEQTVTGISLGRDNLLFESLNAIQRLQAVPVDRLGQPVARARVSYAVDDPAVVRVDSLGEVVALANGNTTLVVASDADTARVALTVAQRPVRLTVSSDTVRFTALGDSAVLSGVAVDSLGSPVPPSATSVAVGEPGVVSLTDSTVRSGANGTTVATVTKSGLAGQVVVVVDQVATTLSAHVDFPSEVITLAAGSPLPLVCEGRDRNGFAIKRDARLRGSRKGTVSGTSCVDARVERSGYDTLVVEMNGVLSLLAAIIATRPDSIAILAAAEPLPTDTAIRYVGDDLGNPRVLSLRPLVAEILAAYGNPTSSLGRARAIRDWVARTAIYPDVRPDSATDGLSVLPAGKTWADVNAVLSPDEYARDQAFWLDVAYDPYLVLDRLLGTLDPATGQRADDGMMVHVAGAHYRMRDIESYRFFNCGFQTAVLNGLWAAAGLHGLYLSIKDHDPAAVFIPELGRWAYEDASFNNDFLLDGVGDPVSPIALLTSNGIAAQLRPSRIAGPSYDPEVFRQEQTYLFNHPTGMAFLLDRIFRYDVPNPAPWSGRFVQVDDPGSDQTIYERVTATEAFPTLGVVLASVGSADSVYVVTLSSNFPNHDRFERRVSGGPWETASSEDVLPVGACSVEYRSIDAVGNASAKATLNAWVPRPLNFAATGDPGSLRTHAKVCN